MMFDVFKETIQSVQSNLSASLRTLSVADESRKASSKPEHLKSLNLYAGVDVLEHFQKEWAELHTQTLENGKLAQTADELIGKLHRRIETQWRNISQVSTALSRLPEVIQEVDTVVEKIGCLDEVFIEVEKALSHLEDLIERRELQERQLDHRFQLALYKEKKLSQLENTRVTLAKGHAQKVALHEARQHRIQRERQDAFEQQFKQDVSLYKETNSVPKATRQTETSDTKLEEVVLDDAEDEGALNEFLHESTPEPQSES